MKLDALRSEAAELCRELAQELSDMIPDLDSNKKGHVKLILDELIKTNPDTGKIMQYLDMAKLSGFWEESHLDDEDDGWVLSTAGFIADRLDDVMRDLHVAEREALHSLQQEASLASTGSKSSLDH